MKILIAEDDPVSRCYLESTLRKWGYEVVAASNGQEAWQILEGRDNPGLAILDWIMPEMDGLEVCRRVRESPAHETAYLIVLTARGGHEEKVRGLESGADDFVAKPFDVEELRARVQVGARVATLQARLSHRVRQLEEAMANVKQLQGLLPICAYCKKIRNDRNYWQQVEGYISEHSEAQFSHGVCPECFAKYVRPELDKLPPPEKTKI